MQYIKVDVNVKLYKLLILTSNNMMPRVTYHTPIPAKIFGRSLWSRSVILWSAATEESLYGYANQPRHYYQVFQPVWQRYLNATDDRRTARTDKQTILWQYRALASQGIILTRKPSYRWQTRATRKPAKNCSNSTYLQRCRQQYWPIFMCLAAVASEICEIPRNSLKIQTYEVQGHPRSSILVPIESPYVTCY